MVEQIDTACCTNGINYRPTASRLWHNCALVLHYEPCFKAVWNGGRHIISGFIFYILLLKVWVDFSHCWGTQSMFLHRYCEHPRWYQRFQLIFISPEIPKIESYRIKYTSRLLPKILPKLWNEYVNLWLFYICMRFSFRSTSRLVFAVNLIATRPYFTLKIVKVCWSLYEGFSK